MKGRMYDPSAGRFLSADPFLDPTQSQGINPYSYVENNPLNLTDPSGLSVWSDDESLFQFMGLAVAATAAGLGVAYLGQTGQLGSWLGWGSGAASAAASAIDVAQLGGGAGAGAQSSGANAPEEGLVREFERQLLAEPTALPPPPAPPTFDRLTETLLSGLVPELEPLAREHVFSLRQTGADARVVQGTRTLRQQAQLYAQGRTAPGPIVTNAAPGTSAHNFGAAYDIGFFENGRYLGRSDLYTTIGPAAAPHGVVWGPNVPGFPPGDVGHYQLPNWEALSSMP